MPAFIKTAKEKKNNFQDCKDKNRNRDCKNKG